MQPIKMVDLTGQYQAIKEEIDKAIQTVVDSSQFIRGPEVAEFEIMLGQYLDAKYVISCASGTDALQLSLMACDLKPGDEVIVPSFTYVATAEVITMLGFVPVFVEVDPKHFTVSVEDFVKKITKKTKAVIPVHLFGQCAEMEEINKIAQAHNISVIEDNAQSIGAEYIFSDHEKVKSGVIGKFGCFSFFPSKNLGCFGDGGAIATNDERLAERVRKIANHGQSKKYVLELQGVNSRLDTLQAAVLKVKLKYLENYSRKRQLLASIYDEQLKNSNLVKIPARNENSTHVFNQYTIVVENNRRDQLQEYLIENDIPSVVYYPIPQHLQKTFRTFHNSKVALRTSEYLSQAVLSLPMHTELKEDQQTYIIDHILKWSKK